MEGSSTVKRISILNYFHIIVRRYLKETVLHALKYVGDRSLSIWERLYFLASFVTVVIIASMLAANVFNRWQNNPVIIAMSSQTTSIFNDPFPAITICNMNQAQHSKVADFPVHSLDYAMLQKLCFQEVNYSNYDNQSQRGDDDTFANFIVRNGQPCDNLILMCKFGPEQRNCTDYFREVLMDEGLCCTFNTLHPFFLYKGEYKLIRDFTLSSGSIPIDWNPELGFPKGLPTRYYPRVAMGSGVSMGFSLVLNANMSEYYCSSTNGPGLKILLHNPIDTPHIKETGLSVRVGHEARFRINARKFEALQTVRGISPQQRYCFFNNEAELHYFKYYSRRNCEMECDAKLFLRLCNCIPNHMPLIYPNASVCHVKHFNCVTAGEAATNDERNVFCKQQCLPSCHDLAYYPDLFTSPLANRSFVKRDPFFRNLSSDYILNNLAFVHFYFQDTFYSSFQKSPYTGFTEFLSLTGGIMSLMMGFSVISVAEVFYFFIMRPIFDFLLKRPPCAAGTLKDNTTLSIPKGEAFYIQTGNFSKNRNPFIRRQPLNMSIPRIRQISSNLSYNLQNYADNLKGSNSNNSNVY